jgi:tetratricopeptide (TPR) repeat protein
MTDRIRQLEKFMEEDSSDPFIHYALALEYAKVDRQKAIDTFEILMRTSRDYLPTYYQLAKLYESQGQKANAVRVFEDGIDLARKQNNLKTLQELQRAREEIEDLE